MLMHVLNPFRTALLWYVASAMSIYIMLEQPQHGDRPVQDATVPGVGDQIHGSLHGNI